MRAQIRAAAVVVVLAAAIAVLRAPTSEVASAPPPPGRRPAPGQPLAAVLHHGGRLDVNRATVEDLAALPGIGPERARRILRHRETIGPFRSVDELAKVRGIGPRTLAKLRDHIELAD